MTDTDTNNLAAMRIPELKALAAEKGIRGLSGLRRGNRRQSPTIRITLNRRTPIHLTLDRRQTTTDMAPAPITDTTVTTTVVGMSTRVAPTLTPTPARTMTTAATTILTIPAITATNRAPRRVARVVTVPGTTATPMTVMTGTRRSAILSTIRMTTTPSGMMIGITIMITDGPMTTVMTVMATMTTTPVTTTTTMVAVAATTRTTAVAATTVMIVTIGTIAEVAITATTVITAVIAATAATGIIATTRTRTSCAKVKPSSRSQASLMLSTTTPRSFAHRGTSPARMMCMCP